MDLEKIKRAIKDSGMTMVAIAEKSGIDRPTLYNRIKGVGQFNVNEIIGISKALRLTPEERDSIFFNE